MARTLHPTEGGAVHHVTTRTLAKAFYLAAAKDKQILVDALRFYRHRGDFVLYGYVVMDNHVHLVIQPRCDLGLSSIVRDVKKWTSRHNQAKPVDAQLWERRYDDNQIRDSKEMRNVLEYMHNNPLRAGIVEHAEDYLWSSARNYAGRRPTVLDVQTEWG